jgi:glycerol-3-phosphate dehydrogenase (NAD(P)+)
MNAVAEGVVTAKAVYHLAQKKKIAMPIVTEVYKIIFENKSGTPCHEGSDGPFFKI